MFPIAIACANYIHDCYMYMASYSVVTTDEYDCYAHDYSLWTN